MTAIYRPELTATEAGILTALENAKGQVLSRVDLSINLYGHLYAGRAIDVHVGRLRKKIGREAIQTVRGRGYLLGKAHACEACHGAGFVLERI